MDDDEAVLPQGGRDVLVIDRRSRSATYWFDRPPTDEVLAHPLLAAVGSIVSHWRGAIALHAGAFVAGRSAWIVLGDRGVGKSTLLAELSLAGAAVLADDLVVIEGGEVHAGPASIDLRNPHREGLPLVDLGMVAGRRRLRLPTGNDGPLSAPLGGILRLAWGEPGSSPQLTPVPPADRAPAIADARSLSLPLADPFALLELAALPAFTFTRPQDLAGLGAATEHLLAHLP